MIQGMSLNPNEEHFAQSKAPQAQIGAADAHTLDMEADAATSAPEVKGYGEENPQALEEVNEGMVSGLKNYLVGGRLYLITTTQPAR